MTILIHQLVRSERKTIALIVNQQGQLIVRAPKRTSKEQIWQFIEEKQDWIREKQAKALDRQAAIPKRQFAAGEKFLFLGREYPVQIVPRARPALALEDGKFCLSGSAAPRAKDVFSQWYREQAREVLAERARLLAARYHLTFGQIKISSARTRWGSCSSLGTLSFTWRLVMAPLEIIDYVVIHELAHLVEKNHSKRFWDQVAKMLPDYQKKRRWLKENGACMVLE